MEYQDETEVEGEDKQIGEEIPIVDTRMDEEARGEQGERTLWKNCQAID